MNTKSSLANTSIGAPTPHSGEILVIDANRASRQSLGMILAPRHHVSLAGDLRRALMLAAARRVDVITLEPDAQGAPVDTGLTAVREAFPEAEIVIVTGRRSLEAAREAIRQRAFDFLLKPFDVTELRDCVNRALLRRRERVPTRHSRGALIDSIAAASRPGIAATARAPFSGAAAAGAGR